MFLFNDGLSLMISRLSLICNKYFLFSRAKTLKLSREGKKHTNSRKKHLLLVLPYLGIISLQTGTKLQQALKGVLKYQTLRYKILGTYRCVTS